MSYKYRINLGTGRLHDPCLYKGGAGEASEEERRLFGVQADTAEFMLGLGKEQLPGAVDRYSEASQRYFDPAYADRMAGQANADAQQAIMSNTASMGRNLGRYGINPNSGRFAAVQAQNALGNTGLQVGAMNAARTHVQDKQFGASKDFYSSMVGMNSDAAGMAGQSATGFGGAAARAEQSDANTAAGLGSAARLGVDAAAMQWADGGPVRKFAAGGLMGGGAQYAPSGRRAPPGPTALGTAASAGQQGLAGYKMGTQLADKMTMGAANAELMAGEQGLAAAAANTEAAALAGGATAAETAAAGTAAAETAAAAGTAAAAETAAAAGTAAAATTAAPALAAASVAMPWVGAAIGIASLFGADLFADGGPVGLTKGGEDEASTLFASRKNIYEALFEEEYVGAPEQDERVRTAVAEVIGQSDATRAAVDQTGAPRDNYLAGGEVEGQGGPTDDTVPAWLSDGEYVLNAETVKQVGRPKLDKMNKKGLVARRGKGA